jgi:tRNA U34 5-carboxymethylaminomethyl modifying enzyme MnmG/GidA
MTLIRLTLTMTSIHALSHEEKFLLSKARPTTLAAAKRIQGITPVAAFALIRHTQKANILAELKSETTKAQDITA